VGLLSYEETVPVGEPVGKVFQYVANIPRSSEALLERRYGGRGTKRAKPGSTHTATAHGAGQYGGGAFTIHLKVRDCVSGERMVWDVDDDSLDRPRYVFDLRPLSGGTELHVRVTERPFSTRMLVNLPIALPLFLLHLPFRRSGVRKRLRLLEAKVRGRNDG
jgi:hypothetical protein